MKKLLMSILSLPIILIILSTNVYAKDTNYSGDVIINYTKNEIALKQKEALEIAKSSQIQLRTGGIVYDWRRVGSTTITAQNIGFAGNQPANGTVFGSNGGFYWQDGGYNSNVTANVEFGWGIFKVSFAASAGSTQSTGYYIGSPYINQACKLYIQKDIEVTQYEVYSKDQYDPSSSWRFAYYGYTNVPTRNYLSVRPV